MKIKLTSVYVDDQEKALSFYTEVLGFAKKADFRQGPFRWLTVGDGWRDCRSKRIAARGIAPRQSPTRAPQARPPCLDQVKTRKLPKPHSIRTRASLS